MKIRCITLNNRRNEFEVVTRSGVTHNFPYAKADPRPGPEDRIKEAFVDRELGNEAFTYVLESGKEGSVHIEQVLEYYEDPNYLAELLTYKLTVEAQRGIENSGLSRRQIAKRLQTSLPQLYRLLDPANTSKSMNQLVTLLHILNRDVDLVVKKKNAA
jgi:predicted XRE-type DNA-binding protein